MCCACIRYIICDGRMLGHPWVDAEWRHILYFYFFRTFNLGLYNMHIGSTTMLILREYEFGAKTLLSSCGRTVDSASASLAPPHTHTPSWFCVTSLHTFLYALLYILFFCGFLCGCRAPHRHRGHRRNRNNREIELKRRKGEWNESVMGCALKTGCDFSTSLVVL